METTLDATELETNVARYLHPLGHPFTVDLDSDQPDLWETR